MRRRLIDRAAVGWLALLAVVVGWDLPAIREHGQTLSSWWGTCQHTADGEVCDRCLAWRAALGLLLFLHLHPRLVPARARRLDPIGALARALTPRSHQ